MGGVTPPIERFPLRLGYGDAGTESILQVVKLAFVCSRVNEGSPKGDFKILNRGEVPLDCSAFRANAGVIARWNKEDSAHRTSLLKRKKGGGRLLPSLQKIERKCFLTTGHYCRTLFRVSLLQRNLFRDLSAHETGPTFHPRRGPHGPYRHHLQLVQRKRYLRNRRRRRQVRSPR
jgi:hypothetical protein